MLNGITFGQYFPAESPIHRLDPRTKLILTIGMIAALFVCRGFMSLLLLAVFIAAVYTVSRVPIRSALKSVKAILPLIILMTLINLLYINGEHVLVKWWVFTVSVEGIVQAAFMGIRVVLLIIVTSLLTYTTSPIDLTDGLERLLSPLRYIKVPVHDLSMIMTIALRFIPTLTEEAEKIMSAQKARGADIETGSLIKRIKALIPILIPLLVSAVRRAAELATAMDCRCYQGGEGRTKMKQMNFSVLDLFAVVTYLLILAGVILINIFVGAWPL